MKTDPYTRTLYLSEDDVKEIIVRYFNIPHGNVSFDSRIGKWKAKIYQYKNERMEAWETIKSEENFNLG